MFSGIGGFELGLHNAFYNTRINKTTGELSSEGEGSCPNNSKSSINKLQSDALVCCGYSEIDKYAIQIYEKHFKGHKNYGNATRIIPKEIPDFDFLCGGFPCQAFSIAGKRGGFKDTRGTLFYEIARIVSVKRPKLLLLENVKGLLSHDRGRTFGTILATFSELGYICEWQVLNSKNFGVPQNRERVFIIGYPRGECRPEVFPIREDGQGNNEEQLSGTETNERQDSQDTQNRRGCSLSRSEAKALNEPQYNKFVESNISQNLTALGKGAKPKCIVKIPSATKKGKEDKKYIPKTDDLANCLTTGKEAIEKWTFENSKIRRLTCVECERLQGFPDGWTEGISDTQRYKCLGNAVTVNVIQAIVERMFND